MSDETHRPGLHRALDVAEALLWVGLLVLGGLVAQAWLADRPAAPSARAAAAPLDLPDLIEAEDMEILSRSREFQTWVQPTEAFATGRWSKDGHLFGFETERGDWIELALPLRDPGRHRLEAWLTRAGDYGIVSMSVNGVQAGSPVDLWSSYVAPTGPIDLGIVELTGSGDVLRLTVTGTHPESQPPHFHFGIDGVRLKME